MTLRKLLILGLTATALVASVTAIAQQAPTPPEPAKAESTQPKAGETAQRAPVDTKPKAEAGKPKSAKAAAARKAVAGQDEPEEEGR